MANVNLQRRHFQFIATMIKDMGYFADDVTHKAIVSHCAARLARTNPYFKSDRFIKWASKDKPTTKVSADEWDKWRREARKGVVT